MEGVQKSAQASINGLQKENLLLRRRSQEVNRTSQFKRLQSELGRQDVMIEALRNCIGAEKAQQLAADAVDALVDKAAAKCSSCDRRDAELFEQDGELLCRSCYSRRYWREPATGSRVQLPAPARFPESREELEKACKAAELELTCAKRALKKSEQSEESSHAEPWAPGLNTAAALGNLLAGYVQRADQLQKENQSLDTNRRQLEAAITEQEHLARMQLHEQVSTLPASKHAAPAVSREDLQTRLEIKSGEVERLAATVEELRRRVSMQSDRQESRLVFVNLN